MRMNITQISTGLILTKITLVMPWTLEGPVLIISKNVHINRFPPLNFAQVYNTIPIPTIQRQDQGGHILAKMKFPVLNKFSLCYFYTKTNNKLNE